VRKNREVYLHIYSERSGGKLLLTPDAILRRHLLLNFITFPVP
jgi:hypothetical protein